MRDSPRSVLPRGASAHPVVRHLLPGFARAAPALLAAALLPAASAADDGWAVAVEAVQLELAGHDRHVLTDRATDAAGAASESTLDLETESALGYRAEIRYGRGRWSYGLDFLIHRTSQDAGPRIGAATAGGSRTFLVGGGQVVSDDPAERLYYERLEDTTVELWTLDLYASRALASGPRGELRWLVGLKTADFDNDYRAVAGIEETGGLRLDAASNYDRMHGPLVGLAGDRERGRHRFTGFLGQSVVTGDVELSSQAREFVGPPSREVDAPIAEISSTRFRTTKSETIPITELRLAWRIRLGGRFAVGLGAFASRWWDVSVPPGVVAGAALDTLDESTIELYGLAASLSVDL
ncbi:MAG TPA: hypothetical protein VGC00_04255 [Thermoanaerobaculia bacterium]